MCSNIILCAMMRLIVYRMRLHACIYLAYHQISSVGTHPSCKGYYVGYACYHGKVGYQVSFQLSQ